MSMKDKKRIYECVWYRYDYDDFGKYSICEKHNCRCNCGGIIGRQLCEEFKKNPDVYQYVNKKDMILVDERFNSRCNRTRNTKEYKLEHIKDMCERQKDALDEIIKKIEEVQNEDDSVK